MSRSRRRRTRTTPAESEIPEQANQHPAPEDDDLQPDPAEEARLAAEDAAVNHFDEQVRDGIADLPDGQEVEVVVEAGTAEPETRQETDLEEIARDVYSNVEDRLASGVTAEWPEGQTFDESEAKREVAYYPRPGDVERDVVNFTDTFPNPVAAPPIPDFEEIFERGPLAAGIRMLEALLAEARIGYIDAQVDELARVTEEDFNDDERRILAEIAEAERSESGLPGIAGAYRTLTRLRAQVEDG